MVDVRLNLRHGLLGVAVYIPERVGRYSRPRDGELGYPPACPIALLVIQCVEEPVVVSGKGVTSTTGLIVGILTFQ